MSDQRRTPEHSGHWWSLLSEVLRVSRSSLVLMATFVAVLLLYMWVRDEPVIGVPPPAAPPATHAPSSASGLAPLPMTSTEETSVTGEASEAPRTDETTAGTTAVTSTTGTATTVPTTSSAQRTADGGTAGFGAQTPSE